MARRRMISEKINYDEEFNTLSIESQLIFLKMLAVADDYGVLPGNLYTLERIINPPDKLRKNLEKYVQEILDNKLAYTFIYNDKKYFMFKENSFDEIQSYLIKNRTKSEYLGLKSEIMEDYRKLQEITGNSFEPYSYHIERYIIRDKDKSKKIKEEITDEEQTLMIQTFGRNPKIPELDYIRKHIDKFGFDKTKRIYKTAVMNNFYSLKTLDESLDESGNIIPKEKYKINGEPPEATQQELQEYATKNKLSPEQTTKLFKKYEYKDNKYRLKDTVCS